MYELHYKIFNFHKIEYHIIKSILNKKMAYTTKELSQKYDGIWDQMDGVYKEVSSLSGYVGEIDEKYNAIWGKVESIHGCNSNIESKYDILAGRCGQITGELKENTSQMAILTGRCGNIMGELKENSGQLAILKSKFDLMKHDMGMIQGSLRKFDKMEDEHIAMMSNMHYDMHEMKGIIRTYKSYNDNKISGLYIIIFITISIIIFLCS